ncbi:transmembrane protein 237-like isoform X1 [Clavelina lepadiformis]|uniref:transmembrane protein 237-like isoform X1 n=1 Tax=Clavelina lepadiformis TaxID=159417 RepID=UPI004041F145
MDANVTALRPLPKRVLPPLAAAEQNDQERVSPTENDHTKEIDTSPKKRPPRKKRTPTPAGLSENEVLNESQADPSVEDRANESSVSSKRARTRRRQANRQRGARTPQVISNGNALTNMVSEGDVVAVDHIDNMVSMTTLPGVAPSGNSQPQERVYVQTSSGFKSHSNEWLENRQNTAAKNLNDQNRDPLIINDASQVALSFHRGFMLFTLILHGLLAGFAVWEVVVAFVMGVDGSTTFFNQYYRLAQLVQTVYYILLVLCLVSAMDRFNLAGKNFFMGLLRVEKGAWGILVYFIAIMFNIGLSGLDFWLGTTASSLSGLMSNATLLAQYPNTNPDATLTTWHVINVLRASFALIGWFLLALYPTDDETSTHLFSSEDEN